MNKYFFLFFLSSFLSIGYAQVATDARTEEYATVRAIISAQTGSFSTSTTLPNPFLEMEGASTELKDQVKDIKGVRFASVADMINYMNKFSWLLLNATTMEIAGSKTNDYMVLYTFKRKPKTK
jgi:hypothetical protein